MADDLLGSIIDELNPDLIPWEFIHTAFVVGSDGIQREVSADALRALMSHPLVDDMDISADLVFDEQRLRDAIRERIVDTWKEVNLLYDNFKDYINDVDVDDPE